MFKKLAITKLIGSALTAIAAVAQTGEPTPKTAIIIQADTTAPGLPDPANPNSSLALAMRSYTDYYLYRTGQDAQTFLLAAPARIDSLVQELSRSGFSRVVYMWPQGKVTQRSVAVAGPRRVRYFTKLPGYLDLTIGYESLLHKDGSWTTVQKGEVRHRARPRRRGSPYLHTRLPRSSRQTMIPEPEPFEDVIQRGLSDVLKSCLTGKTTTRPIYSDTIPTILLIDSSYIRRHKEHWRDRAGELLESASWRFSRQFGVGFQACDIKPVKISDHTKPTVKETYYSFLEQVRSVPETLVVAVGSFVDRPGDRTGRTFNEIGLSQIGQRRILISERATAAAIDSIWQPFFEGLTLVHEIGHAYGALHVSDVNSVMSHQATWIAADRFDPVNRQIIRAALSSELTFDDPVGYVQYVSKVLSESRYALADYPAFFHHFLTQRRGEEIPKKLRFAIGPQSYLKAAEAFRYLMTGDDSTAAALLRQAIRQDPQQASLYYYLSLATGGKESADALDKSARLGYLLAATEKHRLLKEQEAQ